MVAAAAAHLVLRHRSLFLRHHEPRHPSAGTAWKRPRSGAASRSRASPSTGRRKNGDTLWERIRFEVTDVVTSGSLSERLIRASAAVEAPITTGRRIVVVGTAGGAGTSTVTAVLAKLFGSLQQETVMALDSTDQSGRLLRYLGAPGPAPLSALMHQLRTQPVRTCRTPRPVRSCAETRSLPRTAGTC